MIPPLDMTKTNILQYGLVNNEHEKQELGSETIKAAAFNISKLQKVSFQTDRKYNIYFINIF